MWSSRARMKINNGWLGEGPTHINITPFSFAAALLFGTSMSFSFGVIFIRMLSLYVSFESFAYPSFITIDVPAPTTNQAWLSKSEMVDRVLSFGGQQANQAWLSKSGLIDRVSIGWQQANSFEDGHVFEALTHPAMITHPIPKRVAIVGGRDCRTLGEVLKHQAVEQVTVVDIGDGLTDICSQHTESWFDMYDGPMPLVMFEEGSKWLNFERVENNEGKVDVIIMNESRKALSFYSNLNEDNQLESSLHKILSKDGVFVAQLKRNEDEESSMLRALRNADAGFESVQIYDEGRVDFLISFKDHSSRASWFKTSAELDSELHRRLRRSKLSDPPLLFFDAPTMASYQVPSKKLEVAYCTQEDTPEECNKYLGFDPSLVNIPISHLETKKSTVGEFAGRGLFAAQDIPAGAAFDMKLDVSSFQVFPSTWYVIESLYWEFPIFKYELSGMVTFIEGYGYGSNLLGKLHYIIDAGITTFCNHGCNGTYSYGEVGSEGFTEMTVDAESPLDDILSETYPYSPVFERHLRQAMGTSGERTIRDIEKGEEVLCNYLDFLGKRDYWKEYVISLRGQCAGERMGEIAEYESS